MTSNWLAIAQDADSARREHETIGVAPTTAAVSHTQHPDAQWFPDASFGLFIHWGISSVKSMNISWPMIPGRPLASRKIDDPAEQQRIIREGDWNLDGRKPAITPNEYWEMARSFNPDQYDPDKWLKAAKEAGFTYVVLTSRHHEGFALWPSKFGDFSTTNWAVGKDLIRPYVEACRRHGLKVGLYYSPPDWYFDRDYFSFLYGRARQTNPWVPNLGPDLKPREVNPDPEARRKHQEAYAAHVKGQIEELLTNYGKIDVLWFDGRPGIPNPASVVTPQRIRELQPGIVMNGRLHGNDRGDFKTFERTMNITRPENGWAEFCNTWTSSWSHQEIPFRANGYVLGQLVTARSLGVNYLLGVGPMANGEFCGDIYRNMSVVAGWMKTNGESMRGGRPLPDKESASVPAVAIGSVRYLFALPSFKEGGQYEKDLEPATDMTINVSGIRKPKSVTLLGDGSGLVHAFASNQLAVKLPANKRTTLVDVVKVELESAP
jgi:alpha-L-fucosidase